MGWVAQKKKQFIRWYYGEFHYDPKAEVFNFGAVRSRGAQRLSRIVALFVPRG